MLQICDRNLDQLGRREPPGPSRSRWRSLRSLLGLSVASVGALALLGTCLYRRLRHPEWTGAQALGALWPLYLAGAVSICSGWLCSHGKGEGPGRPRNHLDRRAPRWLHCVTFPRMSRRIADAERSKSRLPRVAHR